MIVYKKLLVFVSVFLSILVLFFTFSSKAKALIIINPQPAPALFTTYELTGWAWSNNIGWISFSSKNAGANTGSTYSVKMDIGASDPSFGILNGYAWSPNIGWIKFSKTTGVNKLGSLFYSVPVAYLSGAHINSSTGWGRGCSSTSNNDCTGSYKVGGWDGWIKLSGTQYCAGTCDQTPGDYFFASPFLDGTRGVSFDKTTGNFSGYAWGGDVIGWITFNPKASGVSPVTCIGCKADSAASVTLTPDPVSVQYNSNFVLTWQPKNVTSCTASGAWSGNKSASPSPSYTETISNATSTKTYYISCIGPTGNASATTTVVVQTVPSLIFKATPAVVPLGGDTTLSWTSTGTACSAGGDWNGSRNANGSEIKTGLTSPTYNYTIDCGNATSSLTVHTISLWGTDNNSNNNNSPSLKIRKGQSVKIGWTFNGVTGSCVGSSSVNPSSNPIPSWFDASSTEKTISNLPIGLYDFQIICNQGNPDEFSTNHLKIYVTNSSAQEF